MRCGSAAQRRERICSQTLKIVDEAVTGLPMSEVRRGASGALRLALGLGLGIAAALGAPRVAAQEPPSSTQPETPPSSPVETVPVDGTQPATPEQAQPEPALPEPPAPAPLAPPPSEAPPAAPLPTEPTPPSGPVVPEPAADQQEGGASVRPPVEEVPTAWMFSLVTGYYNPRLGTLNHILKDTSVTIMQDPNFLLPRNQNFPFEERNLPVDGISGGPTYGVDAVYTMGGPHSFGLSFSSWRGETFGQDSILLFIRSNEPAITVPRSARYNLVLDRIFLEWRYHLLRNAEGRGVYLNVGLLGVTMAFLTMDSLVNVVDPDLHFASVSSDESFGWGYTTRFGVGGDYPLTSWLSVGGQANYVLATITKMQVTRHFSAGFPLTPIANPFSIRPNVPLPQTFFDPLEGRRVTYAEITTTGEIQEEAGPTQALALELSGVEAMLKLTIHF
jgi:hypothetical protein